jgi:hypothetical protein
MTRFIESHARRAAPRESFQIEARGSYVDVMSRCRRGGFQLRSVRCQPRVAGATSTSNRPLTYDILRFVTADLCLVWPRAGDCSAS